MGLFALACIGGGDIKHASRTGRGFNLRPVYQMTPGPERAVRGDVIHLKRANRERATVAAPRLAPLFAELNEAENADCIGERHGRAKGRLQLPRFDIGGHLHAK